MCAGPEANRANAWLAGTDGYLVHPFEASHFLAEVEDVVARPDAERHDHRQRQIGLPG
jgi:DNA-binding response OmpR family regulator